MPTAIVIGAQASSELIVGGMPGSFWRAPDKLIAVALACAGAALTATVGILLKQMRHRGQTT